MEDIKEVKSKKRKKPDPVSQQQIQEVLSKELPKLREVSAQLAAGLDLLKRTDLDVNFSSIELINKVIAGLIANDPCKKLKEIQRVMIRRVNTKSKELSLATKIK